MSGSDRSLGEARIRSDLRDHLAEVWTVCPGTRFIEELGLCRGQVRIDVAAVNGVLHGYEIKSDRDRLTRLPLQIEMYGRVVDKATIVVGDRHLPRILDIVPPWWGVLFAQHSEGEVSFGTIRSAGTNPARDPRALVELLWREEALWLLEVRSLAKGVRSKPRPFVWDRVCEHLTVDEIAAVVRDCLRRRGELAGLA